MVFYIPDDMDKLMHLARLAIGITFCIALMLLEALIFLMKKIKLLLEKLFYTMLEATKL